MATEYFSNQTPVYVITALLETHAGLDSEDINLPSIVGSHNLYYQFLDQSLTEMIDSILGYFVYFFHLDTLGTVIAKRINLLRRVDNTYDNEIIDYTPDDSFSSFVNQVVVTGEGHDFLEVLYEVESVGVLSGTILPFGGDETHRVWFSEDHDRTCRNAYLVINKSVRDYELFLMDLLAAASGAVGPLSPNPGVEEVSAVDPDEHYIDITIYAPDLTGMFLTVTANVLAAGTAALTCTYYCGPFIFALSMWTQLMGYILGALAQYDYEIYANPIGHEKQTFQAVADDYVFQRKLNGLVVSTKIDDPFCYEIQQCQIVADRELSIAQAQRSRVSFSKPAHLQDEVGDMLRIIHPYTGVSIDIFITAISRSWQKGVGVIDTIEGWRI